MKWFWYCVILLCRPFLFIFRDLCVCFDFYWVIIFCKCTGYWEKRGMTLWGGVVLMQQVALLPHRSSSSLSLLQSWKLSSWHISSISKIYSGRCTGYAEVPLGVDKCADVCMHDASNGLASIPRCIFCLISSVHGGSGFTMYIVVYWSRLWILHEILWIV